MVLMKGSFWGGVFCGTIAILILGFWPGGWTLESTAERMAQERAEEAVVAVLVPICVEQGRGASVDVRRDLKAESSWTRGDFIETMKWATMPGANEPAPGIASPCANVLAELYSQ